MNKRPDDFDDLLSIVDQQDELEYIDGLGVTRDDLLALAAHYLDVIWDADYWDRFFRQAGGTWERRRMANRRLNVIAETLGDQTLRALVCSVCGVPQHTLWGIDDEMCGECRDVESPRAELAEAPHSTLRSPGS